MLKIRSMGSRIDIDRYLVDAWKRVKNFQSGRRVLQQRGIKAVAVLYLLVFERVRESFALNAGHVNDIAGIDSLAKIGSLASVE